MNIAEKTVDNTISLSQKLYMKNHYRHHHIVTLLRLLILILFLGIWEYAGRIELIDTFFFSSPSMIAAYFKEMLLDGSFITHTGITLLETLISFLLITLISMIIATLLWYSKTLSEILEPYLVVLNSLPKSALAPLFIVWLGTGSQHHYCCRYLRCTFRFYYKFVYRLQAGRQRKIKVDLHFRRQPHNRFPQSSASLLYSCYFKQYEGKYRACSCWGYYWRISCRQKRPWLSDHIRFTGIQAKYGDHFYHYFMPDRYGIIPVNSMAGTFI